ncbi:hypothetical protein ACFOQM_00525 [Paenibacillus sp. GCM10012307]
MKIFIVFVLLFSYNNSITIFASKDESESLITVNTTQNSVVLSFINFDSEFTIEDLNDDLEKIIYSGTDYKVTIDNLTADSLYKYRVSTFDVGNVLESVYYISAQTKKNNFYSITSDDINDVDLSLNAVFSKNSVSLEWTEIEGVTEYQIYKNNELLDTIKENNFIDTSRMTDPYIVYEIQFSLPVSDIEKKEIKQFFINKGKSLSEEELNSISVKPYSIIKVVDASLVIPQLASSTIERSFKWTYKTFIANAFVEDPWFNYVTWGTDIKYFSGDNRGFSSTSESYRTKTVGDSIFYNDSTSSEAFYKNVNPTNAYDENYNLVGTKTDSGSNINRIVNSKTASLVDVTVYHKSGNPYAVSTATIDYQLRAKTYKNGSYSFTGVHDRAPSHELYLRINNVTNITLFTHTNEGFEYLAAPSSLAKSFSVSS